MCDDRNACLLKRSLEGDPAAREQLVTENMGLVWSIVRRFKGRGCDMEDLTQIGCIGLLKAIDKFDLSYEVRFSTYAVPIITGEVKRFLRDDGMIKVSRTLKETAQKAKYAGEQLAGKLGREPTLAELSEAMGLPAEELAAALESGVEVESIYKTIYRGDGSDICLIDRLTDEKNFQEQIMDEMLLDQLMQDLPEEHRRLIELRYDKELTQTQVAEELGISQVQVSRQEKKILQAMRANAHGRNCK